jgi:hypothetical protein
MFRLSNVVGSLIGLGRAGGGRPGARLGIE